MQRVGLLSVIGLRCVNAGIVLTSTLSLGLSGCQEDSSSDWRIKASLDRLDEASDLDVDEQARANVAKKLLANNRVDVGPFIVFARLITTDAQRPILHLRYVSERYDGGQVKLVEVGGRSYDIQLGDSYEISDKESFVRNIGYPISMIEAGDTLKEIVRSKASVMLVIKGAESNVVPLRSWSRAK